MVLILAIALALALADDLRVRRWARRTGTEVIESLREGEDVWDLALAILALDLGSRQKLNQDEIELALARIYAYDWAEMDVATFNQKWTNLLRSYGLRVHKHPQTIGSVEVTPAHLRKIASSLMATLDSKYHRALVPWHAHLKTAEAVYRAVDPAQPDD